MISTFKPCKASGPISIPGNILQLIKLEIATPLSKIINQSIETGMHPDKLKLASVIPVYKKRSKLSTSNYRPISLLSNLNKIFEKIMFERCYNLRKLCLNGVIILLNQMKLCMSINMDSVKNTQLEMH